MRKGKFTHKLLQNFELVNLHTGKLVFRLRRVKMHFGRQSLLLRGPTLWNSVNNETRHVDNVLVNKFKLALKKCGLDEISLIKGTYVNLNKNLDDFIYFEVVLTSIVIFVVSLFLYKLYYLYCMPYFKIAM